jgi:hypothetical protein
MNIRVEKSLFILHMIIPGTIFIASEIFMDVIIIDSEMTVEVGNPGFSDGVIFITSNNIRVQGGIVPDT